MPLIYPFLITAFTVSWMSYLVYRAEQTGEFRTRMREREAHRRTCLHMWRTILRHRRYTMNRLPTGTDGKRLLYGKSKIGDASSPEVSK